MVEEPQRQTRPQLQQTGKKMTKGRLSRTGRLTVVGLKKKMESIREKFLKLNEKLVDKRDRDK